MQPMCKCVRAVALTLGLLAALFGARLACAQTSEPESYKGSFWDRPRLTGDWGGFRDQAAKRGVTLDVDWLQTLQGVMSGGVSKNADYWGTFEYTLNVDTGKLRLWPGGFFTVYALSSYGNNAIKDSGALIPVNTAGILPSLRADEPATGLMQLTFTQFLAPWFGIVVGKLNGLQSDDNAFAHDYRTQFLNLGLNFNAALAIAPFSGYGGALIFAFGKEALITAGVIDPNGTPLDNSLENLFADGVGVSAEAMASCPGGPMTPSGLAGR